MSLQEFIPMSLRYRIMDMRGRGIYSNYADKFQCIFIHIPKTAGVSISLSLFGKETNHVPYIEYEKANKAKFNQYFKFSFVRNPWSRLISSYFFLKKGGLNALDSNWSNENLEKFNDFDSFVKAWITEENVNSWVHFKPQHTFICDTDFNNKMDFIGKMENIQSDYTYVAKKIGCSATLRSENRSKHNDYRSYYTPETQEIVAEVYKKDIELFDYSFEE